MLILHYLWKKFSKFPNAQKNIFHASSFQLCSIGNSEFSFCVSLCEINYIKIQKIRLVLNLSISAEIFCFIYFDVVIRQLLKKKFKLLELFFQSREWNKHVALYNNWYWAFSEILSYSRATYRLTEIRLKNTHFNTTKCDIGRIFIKKE